MNNLHENNRKSDSTQILGRTALPYDYEVEWIKSVGGAYIDLGFTGVCRLNITAGRPYPSSNSYPIFGSRTNNVTNAFCLWFQKSYVGSSSTLRCDYGTGDSVGVQHCPTIDVPNDKLVYYNGTQFAILGVNRYSWEPPYNSQSPVSGNNYLFAVNNNGSALISIDGLYICAAKFMYMDATPFMILKPVVKNNVGLMYDEITGQLFGNANSTGYFEAGPRIPDLTKPWPQGTGNLYAAFNGQGNGTIDVWSDPNDLSQPRSMTLDVHTLDESRHESLLVRQLSE